MKVKSSMVAEVEWFEQIVGQGLLFVLFTSGDSYAYKRVPKGLYEKLLTADSPGTFLNTYIKGKDPELHPLYEYEKINWNTRLVNRIEAKNNNYKEIILELEKKGLVRRDSDEHGNERFVLVEMTPELSNRKMRGSIRAVVDVECEQLETDAKNIEEDFSGQKKEYLHHSAVQLAVDIADRVIMNIADGSVEELDYLTSEVTAKFLNKVQLSVMHKLRRKELNERITKSR